jgi:sugar lactone lactonase YvrE
MRTRLALGGGWIGLGLLLLAGPSTSCADILYVSNYDTGPGGNGWVNKFDTATGTDLGTFAAVNAPQGLAFDSAGNLYVASWGNNTVEKFTPDGVGSVFASTGLSLPTALAF